MARSPDPFPPRDITRARLADLEQRVEHLQRLVRVLACAFLVLAAVVLLPMVLKIGAVLLMIAGTIAIVRTLAEGRAASLVEPLRFVARKVRATF